MRETQKKGQESLKTKSEQEKSENRKRKDKCVMLECLIQCIPAGFAQIDALGDDTNYCPPAQ